MTRPIRFILAAALLCGAPAAFSQQIQPVRTDPVQIAPFQQGAVQTQGQQSDDTQLNARDRAIAQMWNLSDDEMRRAKVLLLGPRGSFSVSNLSPVEALGIHARNDAERLKYAELFARAQYEDVQRVLAFQAAYGKAIGQLSAGQPLLNFAGLPKVDATEGAADMMGVPRSQLSGRNPFAPVRGERP